MSTYKIITIGIGAFGLTTLLLFLIAAFYMAYFKFEALIDYFRNSPAVTIRLFLLDAGPWGRLYVVGFIMGMTVIPNRFIKDGGVCAEDLSNVPRTLRLTMKILIYSAWTGLFLVVATAIALEAEVLVQIV